MRPMDKPKVIRAVPRTDRNDLYHTVDGYDFIYENPTYGKADVCRPGFFNTFRDELKVGMMIECRLGDIADGITQTWVQVIERPKSELGGDVMVSLGPSKKFTPVRHSGALEDEREVA